MFPGPASLASPGSSQRNADSGPTPDLRTQSLFFVLFCFGHVARGILVPPLGIELVLPAVEDWSPNQWTTGGIPRVCVFHKIPF